jgi:hypothetical protein
LEETPHWREKAFISFISNPFFHEIEIPTMLPRDSQ